MNPKEEFPGRTKEDAIMRMVLSMPKDTPFMAKEVIGATIERNKCTCIGITSTAIGVILRKYEGKYVERVKYDRHGNTWKLIV